MVTSVEEVEEAGGERGVPTQRSDLRGAPKPASHTAVALHSTCVARKMPRRRAAGRSATAHAWVGRLRRRGPVCLIIERLPEVILEHILGQLPAWYLAQSVSTCKAFRAHACAAAKVRALALQLPPWPMPKELGKVGWPTDHPWPMPKHLSDATGWASCQGHAGRSIPPEGFGHPGLFCRLHLLESLGEWFTDVIFEDPQTLENPVMVLEHRSSGARVHLDDERVCDGYIRFQRRQDAPWEVVDYGGGTNQLDRHPLEAHQARIKSPPCWYANFECDVEDSEEHSTALVDRLVWIPHSPHTSGWKNWHFSPHPRGLEITCLGDALEHPIPSLLTANGAVLKGDHLVGLETDLDPGAIHRRPLERPLYPGSSQMESDRREYYVRLREDPLFQ